MAIYFDCGGELISELFWVEIIGGSMLYLPYSIQDDSYDYHGDYQFFRAEIFFVQEINFTK